MGGRWDTQPEPPGAQGGCGYLQVRQWGQGGRGVP